MLFRNKILLTILGVIAYLIALLPYAWYDLFGYGYTLWVQEGLPIILWTICFFIIFKKYQISIYWWVLPSGVICCWPFVKTIFSLVIWKIGGFGP